MSIPYVLAFAATLTGNPAPFQPSQDAPFSYGASVTFEDGRCWFWTGDSGMTDKQFEADLASRFDVTRRIIISRPKNIPKRCMNLARRAAMQAGFKRITTSIRPDAGPIGPPMNDG